MAVESATAGLAKALEEMTLHSQSGQGPSAGLPAVLDKKTNDVATTALAAKQRCDDEKSTVVLKGKESAAADPRYMSQADARSDEMVSSIFTIFLEMVRVDRAKSVVLNDTRIKELLELAGEEVGFSVFAGLKYLSSFPIILGQARSVEEQKVYLRALCLCFPNLAKAEFSPLLVDVFAELVQFKQLQRLCIGTEVAPAQEKAAAEGLQALTNLKEFYWAGMGLKRIPEAVLCSLPAQLEVLFLSSAALIDLTKCGGFGHLQSLRELEVWAATPLTKAMVQQLSPQLRKLHAAIEPDAVAELAKRCPLLETLEFEGNVTKDALRAIAPGVKYLDVYRSSITDGDLAVLREKPLKKLWLSDCDRLTGEFCSSLPDSLQDLFVSMGEKAKDIRPELEALEKARPKLEVSWARSLPSQSES